MILYIRALKDSTRKLGEIINKVSNVAKHKINLHKSKSLSIHQQQTYRERDHIYTPISRTPKKIKYLEGSEGFLQ